MNYAERADNVYMIDTKMFGFDQCISAYFVEAKPEEIAARVKAIKMPEVEKLEEMRGKIM